MNDNLLSSNSNNENNVSFLAKSIVDQYKITTIGEIEETLHSLVGPMVEAILKGELDSFLQYPKGSHEDKQNENRRNGYTHKTIKTKEGEIEIKSPRDRLGQFEPLLVPKRCTNLTDTEDLIQSLYAKGMSVRDITDTVQNIYNCSLSPETISHIVNRVQEEVNIWRTRPLDPIYVFTYVDCIYVTVRNNGETKNNAVYVILGINIEGKKDILGIWIADSEGKHYWMQIFDEIRSRGVEDVLFISMDGVTGLEEGAKSIFPNVTVQRCIVHLIRNSIKYIPRKDYKSFTDDLKLIYGAINLEIATENFNTFKEKWSNYPQSIAVWENNWTHIEQLFNYGKDVRRVIYTTNPLESVNSSFRKVCKKGAFQGYNSVFNAFYLRVKELKKRWTRSIHNWSLVLNQLLTHEEFEKILRKYLDR